jgi:hypothetical protein
MSATQTTFPCAASVASSDLPALVLAKRPRGCE